MTEGFTITMCWRAPSSWKRDSPVTVLKSTFLMIEGFTNDNVLKSTFLFNRGFHQMTVLKSTFLINRGIYQMTASNAVPKQTIIALLCVQTHYNSPMLMHILCCTVVPSSSLCLSHTAVSTLAVVLLHFTYISLQTLHCCAFLKDQILCLFWNNYTVPIYKFTLLCVNISYTHCCCIYCISIQWTTNSSHLPLLQ